MFRDRQKALKQLEEQLLEEEEDLEPEEPEEEYEDEEDAPRQKKGCSIWLLLFLAGLLAAGYFLLKKEGLV